MQIAYILKTEEETRRKSSGVGYEFNKLAKPKYYIGFVYRDNLYCWYLNSGGLNYCNGDLINI